MAFRGNVTVSNDQIKQGKKALPLVKTVWRLLLPYMGEVLKSLDSTDST